MSQDEARVSLIRAMIAVQKEIRAMKKNKTAQAGQKFSYDYIDLPAVMDYVLPLLSKNGLSLSQAMSVVDGHSVLVTSIFHEGGASLQSQMMMPPSQSPREVGSAITYYRRYQIMALVGISAEDEDDDAEKATPRYQEPRPAVKNHAPQATQRPSYKDALNEKKTAIAAPDFGPAIEDPGSFQIPFGKWKGRTIDEIGIHEAQKYLDWLEGSAKQKGKELEGSAQTYKEMVHLYAEKKAAQTDLGGPPPDFWPDPQEEIPF